MATLTVHLPDSAPTHFRILKPLVSIGAASDSDIRIPHMRGIVAVQFDGRSFTATSLEGAPLVVNGRKRDRHALDDGDTLEVAGARLVFEKVDREIAEAELPGRPRTMPRRSPSSGWPSSHRRSHASLPSIARSSGSSTPSSRWSRPTRDSSWS